MAKRLPRNMRYIERDLQILREAERKERLEKKADIFQKIDIDEAYKFAEEHIGEVQALATEPEFESFMSTNGFKIDNVSLGKIYYAIKKKEVVKPQEVVPEIKTEEPTVESQITAAAIEKFWVVTKPSGESTLADILFESHLTGRGGMEYQFMGGLKGEEIVGIWTDYNEAKVVAEKLLEGQKGEGELPSEPEIKSSSKKTADETKMETDPKTGKPLKVIYKDNPEYKEPERRTIEEPTDIKNADETLKILADELKKINARKIEVDHMLTDIINKAEVEKEKKSQELGEVELSNKIIALSKSIKTVMEKAGVHAADLGADILALTTEVSKPRKEPVSKADLVAKLKEALPGAEEAIKTIEDNALRVQTIQEQLTRYPKTKEEREQKAANTEKQADGNDILDLLKNMYEGARDLLLGIKSVVVA